MNLFDMLVTQALTAKPELSPLRAVVEKELLHFDILKIMQEHNLLSGLTFIGGTCLRTCYQSNRLSEDLDFTGGKDFNRETLSTLGKLVSTLLEEKYSLLVTVTEPEKDILNVDTWKIKIFTQPEKKHMPAQRINIDVCGVQSYERVPLLVRNSYGIEVGTSNLIIKGQTREEIFTDKLLAFAFRPNRIKYRDLWDIMWLHTLGIAPRMALIKPKLAERHHTHKEFYDLFVARIAQLETSAVALQEFKQEMSRFLSQSQLQSGNFEHYWQILIRLMHEIRFMIEKSN